MNMLSAALAGAAGLLAISFAQPVAATGAVQHCRASDGVAVYTDRGCAALDAQPVPMPDELVRRIASTGAHSGYVGRRSPAPPRRPTARGCARSAAQLASDLRGAFALGDVNRIAESYHWVGLSHRQGQHVMQRLERLSERTLLQTHYFDASIRSGWVQVADARTQLDGSGGMMQLVFGEARASSALDLDVRRYHGCYFVRFP
jgi:hypothetical protein